MSEDNKKVTTSGIEIDKIYFKKEFDLEAPGEFPFTRGVHKGMYRDRFWTMRQYAGFSTAEASNERYTGRPVEKMAPFAVKKKFTNDWKYRTY